jgi:hypothetical protein
VPVATAVEPENSEVKMTVWDEVEDRDEDSESVWEGALESVDVAAEISELVSANTERVELLGIETEETTPGVAVFVELRDPIKLG